MLSDSGFIRYDEYDADDDDEDFAELPEINHSGSVTGQSSFSASPPRKTKPVLQRHSSDVTIFLFLLLI